MQRDIRDTGLYREAEAINAASRRPGTGQISDAAEVSASPDGRLAAFTGSIVDRLDGAPPTRICLTELASGATRVLTFGPHFDRLPKFSPDGKQIAFLSDRHRAGDFQLYLLDPATGAVKPTPPVGGWVEYFHWSPDGARILLAVAGHGADISGGQGAVTSRQHAKGLPSWTPSVETADEEYRWRHAWVCDLAGGAVRQVSRAGVNVWETVWCGNDAIAAVISPAPGESLWYDARLAVIDVNSGAVREIFRPKDQAGWPAASPSGKTLAIVESISSDRWSVAGELRLIDTASGDVRPVETNGIDITCTEWRSEHALLLGGHRGFETVVALYDVVTHSLREVWSSTDVTTAHRYIAVSGIGESGDCLLIGESFTRAPEVGLIRSNGEYRSAKSFDIGYGEQARAIGAVERVSWKAPDGLEIQGWLVRPQSAGPHPLIMQIHGGPVSHARPIWLARRYVHVLMLCRRGYAVFFPNPRGSTGRGQDFARRVLGDMGGADTHDYLSGVDHLVAQGIADPERLGLTGTSYGGFMTSWLITQDTRFAAAVPISPVTNQVTEHLISNIPRFVSLFLDDTYTNPTGRYFDRSPIMHAHKAKTPTLNICGTLDRCTPPEEAVQFHNALLENGVKSVLVTYPTEGHGVRNWPAYIDYTARLVGWFEQHMGDVRS